MKKKYKYPVFNIGSGSAAAEGTKVDNETRTVIIDAVKNTLGGHLEQVKASAQESEQRVLNKVDEVKNDISDKVKTLDERVSVIAAGTLVAGNDQSMGYANSHEYLMDVMNYFTNRSRGRNEVPKRLLNTVGGDEARIASNPDGGFLVPPAFLPELFSTPSLGLQENTGARTRSIPMDTDVIHINARVDNEHTSSVSGGLRVYRRAEAEAVASSKQTFAQIKLEASALTGVSFATEELLNRSPSSFIALLQSSFGEEIASRLNEERIWGSGIDQFLGVMKSPALITVDKEGSQAPDTILAKNLYKMRSRCWGYQNAIWMANQDTIPSLMELTDANGNKLWHPSLQDDKPDRLLGRPIVFDENMATLGELGDIGLFNWNEFLEGWRGGINFAESIHVRFLTSERCFKVEAFNAGAPWWMAQLKPKKSNITLSPFVALAKR